MCCRIRGRQGRAVGWKQGRKAVCSLLVRVCSKNYAGLLHQGSPTDKKPYLFYISQTSADKQNPFSLKTDFLFVQTAKPPAAHSPSAPAHTVRVSFFTQLPSNRQTPQILSLASDFITSKFMQFYAKPCIFTHNYAPAKPPAKKAV